MGLCVTQTRRPTQTLAATCESDGVTSESAHFSHDVGRRQRCDVYDSVAVVFHIRKRSSNGKKKKKVKVLISVGN